MSNSTQKKFGFLIVFLISSIFLFPAFLGKVDTPVDIRDFQIYPWSYWSVDKKMKTITLWDSGHLKEQLNSEQNYKLKLDKKTLDELSQLKPTDTTFYFTFDLKELSKKKKSTKLEVSLIERVTNLNFKLPSEVLRIPSEEGWLRVFVSLKEVLKSSLSVVDLNSYDLKISLRDDNQPLIFYIKDLKLLCDDYSQVVKVHNKNTEDLIQGYTPIREHLSESLKKGKIPFWNNYILTGTEFLNSDPQLGYFHPLYFLIYFLFDHFTAHLLISFLCLTLSGIGAYLLSRYWGLGFAASVFSAIVYMFHPYNVLWFSFEHMIMNSATLPFLILSYEKNLKEKSLLNNYLLISTLLLGLIFISGHLQIVYYTIIFFFLYALFSFFSNKDFGNYRKHAFSIIFLFLVALMMAGIVLIPFFPFLQNSHRVAFSWSTVKEVSISLKSFLNLIKPSAVDGTTMSYLYFGILPLLVSLISLTMKFNKRLTVFLFLLVIISILVSTGSPLFFLVKDYIPGFKLMQHHRFIEIYSYSVPFLAGIGLQVLINHFSFLKKKLLLGLVTLVVIVSAIDLIYHSSFYVTWLDRKDYKPIPKGGSLEFILNEKKKSSEPFRVLPFVSRNIENVRLRTSVAIPNTLLPYKIEDISGYSSFIPRDIYSLFLYIQTKDPEKLYSKEIVKYFTNFNIPYPISNYRSKVIDLLNVKYFLVPNFFVLESKDTKKVYSGDLNIYENLNYLPRAFVVPEYKVIESPKNTIVYLDSEEFNPRQEVVLMTYEERSAINNEQSAIKSDVKFLKYEQDNITLKVEINNPGFLLLGNNLNDNWKVRVNREEGKHIQANLVQRAVYLPKAGRYEIEFYYFPKLFLIGLSITCFALLILISLGIFIRLGLTQNSEKGRVSERT